MGKQISALFIGLLFAMLPLVAFADGPLPLPDVTSQIWTYLNALLSWSPIVILITVTVAAATASIVIALFLRAFMRG